MFSCISRIPNFVSKFIKQSVQSMKNEEENFKLLTGRTLFGHISVEDLNAESTT